MWTECGQMPKRNLLTKLFNNAIFIDMKKLILLALLVTPFMRAVQAEEEKPRVCYIYRNEGSKIDKLTSGDFGKCKAGDILVVRETTRLKQLNSVCKQGTINTVSYRDSFLFVSCTLLAKEDFLEIVEF